jgi:hypothetical protein
MPSMLGQSLGWLRGVGRADGRHSGPGSVGSRGWSCPGRGAVGRRRGWPGHSPVWSGRPGAGLVELAVAGTVGANPHRLAAGSRDRRRTTGHGEGSIGAAAAGMRPGTEHDSGHDRAHPAAGEQVRSPAWTRMVMARVWSAISRSRSWMRRARAGRLAAVAADSESKSARSRSRPQALTRRGVVSHAAGSGARQERRVQGRAAAAERWWRPGPLSGARSAAPGAPPASRPLGAGRAGHGPGLTGRPGGIQRVGLGAVAAGGPLGRSSSTTCSA